jgi:hypothetical protein
MFRRFDIACRRVRASEIPVTGKATELVLNLCQNLGATRYLSGQGAKAYQTPEQFATAGIELTYQGYEGPVYPQLYPQTGFVPHLSAVDLLFNVGERAAEVLRSGQK